MKRFLTVLLALILTLALPLTALSQTAFDAGDEQKKEDPGPGSITGGEPIPEKGENKDPVPENKGDGDSGESDAGNDEPDSPVIPAANGNGNQTAPGECQHTHVSATPNASLPDANMLLYNVGCTECGRTLRTTRREVSFTGSGLNLGGYGTLLRVKGEPDGFSFGTENGLPKIRLDGFDGTLEVRDKTPAALSFDLKNSNLTLDLHLRNKVYNTIEGTPDSSLTLQGCSATIKNMENFQGSLRVTGGAEATLHGNIGATLNVDADSTLHLDDGIVIGKQLDVKGTLTVGDKRIPVIPASDLPVSGLPKVGGEPVVIPNAQDGENAGTGTGVTPPLQANTSNVGLLQAGGTAVFAVGENTITVNGETFTAPDAPYIQDSGFTMVPMSMLSVLFEDKDVLRDSGGLTFSIGEKVIRLNNGSNIARVNGSDVMMSCAAIQKNGTLFLPISEVVRLFGLHAEFDFAEKTVKLTVGK